MSEFNRLDLKKSAAKAGIYLVIKRVGIQVIFTLSNIILTRLLFPTDFGTFALITFIATFFTVLSDLGIGPALVQKKEPISEADIRTAFTFQIVLGAFVTLVLIVTSGLLTTFFNLPPVAKNLLQIFSISFLIVPFKNVSVAILERSLQYKYIALIESLEIFVTALVTILLALRGFGVYSFVYGLLCGYLITAVSYISLRISIFRLGFSYRNFLALVKFGFPYQSQIILGVLYGPLVLLYFGSVVGAENLGYHHFASGLAALPLFLSEIINRITFPLIARAQTDVTVMSKIVEEAFTAVVASTAPLIMLLLGAGPLIIQVIYSSKWLPALPILYILLLQSSVLAVSSFSSQVLLATGNGKTIQKISVVWAVLTWLIVPSVVKKFGLVGMSIASFLVALTGIWLLYKVVHTIRCNLSVVFPLIIISMAELCLIVFLQKILAPSLFTLFIVAGVGLTFYVGLSLLYYGKRIFLIYTQLLPEFVSIYRGARKKYLFRS